MKSESIIRTEQTESLYVKLTDEEKQERARTAANVQGYLADAEWKLKCATEAAKREIKDFKAEIKACVEAHNSGREHRIVPCIQVFDLVAQQTWFEYRGDEYQRRAMHEDELKEAQKNLFNDGPIHGRKEKPRAADAIAQEHAEKLPDTLARAKAPKKAKKPKPLTVVPPDDPREDIGYGNPKKDGGKSV